MWAVRVIADIADLTAAPKQKEIAAGLMFSKSSVARGTIALNMENVITPHIAAASSRIAERHLETLLDNIRRFVGGRPQRGR